MGREEETTPSRGRDGRGRSWNINRRFLSRLIYRFRWLDADSEARSASLTLSSRKSETFVPVSLRGNRPTTFPANLPPPPSSQFLFSFPFSFCAKLSNRVISRNGRCKVFNLQTGRGIFTWKSARESQRIFFLFLVFYREEKTQMARKRAKHISPYRRFDAFVGNRGEIRRAFAFSPFED